MTKDRQKIKHGYDVNYRCSSSPGAGKVRPAGNSGPLFTEVFCQALGEVITTQTSYFSCKNSTLRSCLLKSLAQRVQIFFETARGFKKFPIPGLTSNPVFPKKRSADHLWYTVKRELFAF